MEEEKFGVELELKTSKFRQKMEETKSKIKDFGKMAKQSFNIGLKLNASSTKKDIENLKQQFKDEIKKIEKDRFEVPINIEFDNSGNLLLEDSSLEKLQRLTKIFSPEQKKNLDDILNKIQSLSANIKTLDTSKIAKLGKAFSAIKTPIDKIKTSIKTSKNGMNEFDSSVNKTFKKGIASIKRFALSLFGIQTIWRGVSKASSAYLSQDIELSNKLQAVWIGLGAMIAPLLEKMANFFLKLVGYLNIFLTKFTGFDFLGDAMAKVNNNTKSTTKSVKELKGQLAGFDEINNIADDSNNDGGSVGSPDINWPDAFSGIELDTGWTETITNFGSWMEENWPIVLGLMSGTVFTLELIKSGVKGIKALGIGLILAGIVITISSIVEFIKDPSWNNFANILIGLATILAGVAVAMLAVNAANPVAWIILAIAAVVAFSAVIIKNWDKISQTLKNGCEKVKGFFSGLWNGIKKIFSPAFEYFKSIWSPIKKLFVSVGTTVGNAMGESFKNVVNAIIKFAEKTINGFIKAINVAIGVINVIPGVNIKKLALLNIPKLDTGTNFVPNDQLAYIHKGEAVVPKKFNSDNYFNRGNDETNDLLRELIETIDDKDTNIYLDEKKIGESTRKYLISQKRIMGRSVV